MRIQPIMPIQPMVTLPQRAYMVIHHKEHIVVTGDGERFPLPPEQAWELHTKLNSILV